MQIILSTPLKVNREHSTATIDHPATVACPMCTPSHQLWRHGWYQRDLIHPGGQTLTLTLPRLICRYSRRTVSILPNDCLPGLSYSAASIGRFFDHYNAGAPMREALATVNPRIDSTGLGYQWLARINRGLRRLELYAAAIGHRAAETLPSSWRRTWLGIRATAGLLLNHDRLETALPAHNTAFFAKFQVSII